MVLRRVYHYQLDSGGVLMKHALIALLVQAIVAQFAGWWTGAALAAGYFIGREFAQAEYRIIVTYCGGKRSAMPWWGGFDPRAWNAKSLADWAAPAVAVCALAFFQG